MTPQEMANAQLGAQQFAQALAIGAQQAENTQAQRDADIDLADKIIELIHKSTSEYISEYNNHSTNGSIKDLLVSRGKLLAIQKLSADATEMLKNELKEYT